MQANSKSNGVRQMEQRAIAALLEFWKLNSQEHSKNDFFMGDDFKLYFRTLSHIDISDLDFPELGEQGVRVVPTAKLSIDNETIIPAFRVEKTTDSSFMDSVSFDINGLAMIKNDSSINEQYRPLLKDNIPLSRMDINDSIIEAAHILKDTLDNVKTLSM